MVNFLEFLTDLFKTFNNILNKLSQPNSSLIHDKTEYEITHMRVKALLIVNIVITLIFFTDMLANKFTVRSSLIRCGIGLMMCGILILSSRVHMNIFSFLANVFCVCYGPYIMNMGEGGIHRAWILSVVFPLYLYVFIGDYKSFFFQTTIQVLYVNKVYNPIMEKAVSFMTPEAFTKTLTYSTNLASVFFIILVLFAHYFMNYANKKIIAAEKKRDEIENQKTFLLGFSHELRNLINSLTGNVKLASLETLTPKARELLLNAEVCGELLLHLVNNILDTGKVEIGELEINPVPTRIYETLERIWGICSELIKRKNIGGRIRISKHIPKNLMIDHYRLTQIFLNLVGNSVKFTDRGSVEISVEWLSNKETVDEECFLPYPYNYYDDHDEGLFEKQRSLGYIDVDSIILGLSSRKVNPNMLKETMSKDIKRGVLKIVVSDTGLGMSKEEIQKLFQKFSQVTSNTSKRKLGTGLGLFITKELCLRMKGDIKAFSEKNLGSSFMFCIPADVVKEENNFSSNDIESLKRFVRSQNLKAMIVDDISFNHGILKNFFDKLGIEVSDIANDGLEAYKKYCQKIERGERLDIITMDLEMPVMDGKEAAQKIRKIEEEKGIRSCFMPIISANCSESEIKECLNKQGDIKADRFIKKPATLDELLRAIGSHFASLEYTRRNL